MDCRFDYSFELAAQNFTNVNVLSQYFIVLLRLVVLQ